MAAKAVQNRKTKNEFTGGYFWSMIRIVGEVAVGYAVIIHPSWSRAQQCWTLRRARMILARDVKARKNG